MATDKNNSVTPCVLFDDDQFKTTILPLVFYLTGTDKRTTMVIYQVIRLPQGN